MKWLGVLILAVLVPTVAAQQGVPDRQYGPALALDSKGTDIGPWVRQFVGQVRQNWSMPSNEGSGHVVLTFYVDRDGNLEELTITEAAAVEAFNDSALAAFNASDPTQAIPSDYPDDRLFVTAKLYFNEKP